MPVFQVQPLLEHELEYPVALSAVRERVGDVVLEAPDVDESMTIGQVLEYVDDQDYASADDLFLAILASVPEEYVGHKFRSGRGVVIDEVYEPEHPSNSF